MDPLICHASGEPIPFGAAFITDADGNNYLPEHYPDPVTGESEAELQAQAESAALDDLNLTSGADDDEPSDEPEATKKARK